MLITVTKCSPRLVYSPRLLCTGVSNTMSEDEDEELAMLRLQALMSKRRGGAGASKDLPFPLSLPPLAVQPVAPISTETPATTSPAVVTSDPAAITDALPGINDSVGMYRQPCFRHGEASYRNDISCFCNFSLCYCCIVFLNLCLFFAPVTHKDSLSGDMVLYSDHGKEGKWLKNLDERSNCICAIIED